ncbi:hypothetical protein [Bacillus mycoides]|uniref:hypothetical protein n=1 Tax=Bacillus mycoides TaxID=1405 RepID=UPI0025A053D3|nr:hypothetical protein [Bacillus mycoides]MDM5431202.1 hypothetical protein [Bacillus mycoides]
MLIRNVLSYSKEDEYSVTYVRDIVDALHNIPHSIQKQHDKFLEFEFKLLEETLMQMDFGKVATQNIPYFKMYAVRIQQLLQKHYKGV